MIFGKAVKHRMCPVVKCNIAMFTSTPCKQRPEMSRKENVCTWRTTTTTTTTHHQQKLQRQHITHFRYIAGIETHHKPKFNIYRTQKFIYLNITNSAEYHKNKHPIEMN